MKRKIDVDQVLQNFEGKPIKETADEKSPDLILKRVLLIYLRNANQMGLSREEETIAFEAGCLLGISKGKIEITTAQYDVVKKLVDKGQVKDGAGRETDLFGLEIKIQAKQMVDGAEIIEQKKET